MVASLPGPAGRLFGRKKKSMTTIWVDSRKRVAGTDFDFEFDVGETVHLQGSARLGVFKIRVADTFLSTDRGTFLYWKDEGEEPTPAYAYRVAATPKAPRPASP